MSGIEMAVVSMILVPVLAMAISGLENLIAWVRETWGGDVVCECTVPSRGGLGSTFVCPECARKWWYTHDNIAWAGWVWAPWWKRIQMRLGAELPGKRVS